MDEKISTGENARNAQKKKNPHAGHRQRMRNRFLTHGLAGFHPHEVLELLLFYVQAQKNQNELAHQLLDTFGSLRSVFDAPVEELMKVEGIGEISVTLLKLIPPLSRMYLSEEIAQRSVCLDSIEKMQEYFLGCFTGIMVEQVRAVCLNDRMQMVKSSVVSEGDLNSTGFSLRKLAGFASEAAGNIVILAHNHPTGALRPSADDIKSTMDVYKMLKTIGIQLYDHIIVAKDQALSMRDIGAFLPD